MSVAVARRPWGEPVLLTKNWPLKLVHLWNIVFSHYLEQKVSVIKIWKLLLFLQPVTSMSSLNAKARWKHCCNHALCSLKETSMHRPQANTTTKYPAGEWGAKRFVLDAICLNAAQFLICSSNTGYGLKWCSYDISKSWVSNHYKPRVCVDVTIGTACRAVLARF